VAPSVESRGHRTTTAASREQTLSGLSEDEVLQLVWTLSPPDCVDVDPLRKSTWMRPIIGSRELHGRKLLPCGSSSVQSSRTAQRMLHDFYFVKYILYNACRIGLAVTCLTAV